MYKTARFRIENTQIPPPLFFSLLLAPPPFSSHTLSSHPSAYLLLSHPIPFHPVLSRNLSGLARPSAPCTPRSRTLRGTGTDTFCGLIRRPFISLASKGAWHTRSTLLVMHILLRHLMCLYCQWLVVCVKSFICYPAICNPRGL